MQTEAQKKAQKKYRKTEKGRKSQRLRDKRRHEKLRARRDALVQKFGGRCQVCGRKPRYLAFHHLKYIANIKVNGRVSWERIVREVEEHPERFRLLCNACHSMVTTILKDRDSLARLIGIVELSSLLVSPQKV